MTILVWHAGEIGNLGLPPVYICIVVNLKIKGFPSSGQFQSYGTKKQFQDSAPSHFLFDQKEIIL